MDNLILHAITRELAPQIAGARIDKVLQIARERLVLRLWNGRERLQLLLAAEPGGGVRLSSQSHATPFAPPRFCQLLRARLKRLLTLEPPAGLPLVRLHCEGKKGDNYLLVLDLSTRPANLSLVDGEGKIVDSLVRFGDGDRSVRPGLPYPWPALVDGTRLDSPDLPALVDGLDAEGLKGFLSREVFPMSPFLAHALVSGVRQGVGALEVLQAFQRQWQAGELAAYRVELNGRVGLLPLGFGLDNFESAVKQADFSSALECLEQSSGSVPGRGRSGQADLLRGALARQGKRLKRRLENLERDQQRFSDPERDRELGELLLANLRRIPRHCKAVQVENYYRDPPGPVEIALDPRWSPQENAEIYFRRFKKGKRAAAHLERRAAETEQEQQQLGEWQLFLEEAETAEDIYLLRQELEEAGLVGKERMAAGRRVTKDPLAMLHQALTPGGFQLFWGKNGRTNDYVSTRLTRKEDLWFHAQGAPGCHLVLRREAGQGEVPEEDRLFAAALAAGYSQAKGAGKVEVMMTEGRWLSKPKGARPGLVTVQKYRTLVVPPRRLEAASGIEEA